MKKPWIILIDTGSESNHMMMSDVGNMDNAIQISDLYQINNNIMLKRLFQLHYGFKLNKKYDVPFKSVWDKRCVLNWMLSDHEQEYYLIMVNDVIRKFSDRYLYKLNQMKNVHIYVLLLDSYQSIQPYFRRCVDKVRAEQVYSFQESDCFRYGFRYTNTLYSKIGMNNNKEGTPSDIYFIGAEKNRINDIVSMYRRFSNSGYNCKFIVITSKSRLETYKKKYPGIDFRTTRVGYREVLRDIQATRCILELCQEGQDGLTMRFYEAVFYNKYLITNNETARQHELYNDAFMLIFHSADGVDVEKLDLSKKVNYHYQNEMSPVHFVETILSENVGNRGFLK